MSKLKVKEKEEKEKPVEKEKEKDKPLVLPKIKKNRDRDDLEDMYFTNSKYAIKLEVPKSPLTPTRASKKTPQIAPKKLKEEQKSLPPIDSSRSLKR
jgi:hypothetical protein